MKAIKVTCTLVEPILGTSPANGDIYDSFIASKVENRDYSLTDYRPEQEETEKELLHAEEVVQHEGSASEEDEEQKVTVFCKDDNGNPFLYDYMIKGFFKDTCQMLQRSAGKDPETGKRIAKNYSAQMKAYKKVIDGNIWVFPRMIPFGGVTADDITYCQRPLRAQTPQGERVALAKSEQLPAGATLQFIVKCDNDADMNAVIEWLDNGVYRGFCQWRNAGYGRFLAEYEDYEWNEADYRNEVKERAKKLARDLKMYHRMKSEQ